MNLKKHFFSFAIFLLSVHLAKAQTTTPATLQAGSRIIIDDGLDHAEIAVKTYSTSHAILFGAKSDYKVTGNIWKTGNTVYASDAGAYSYGAFSMGYQANGGLFNFYDGGLSTGKGTDVNWTPIMTMVRGGNIGIGTSFPSAKLEVNGNTILGSSTQGSSVIINDVPGARYSISTGEYNLTFSQHNSSSNAFVPRFTIANGGNIGIGTSTAAEKLTVAGTDGNIFLGPSLFPEGYNGLWLNGSTVSTDYNLLSRAGDKNFYLNRPSDANIIFRMSNNTQATLDPSGNFALGDHTPVYKLDMMVGKVNDGILMRNPTAGWLKISNNNAGPGSYNDITHAGDATIIYGSGTTQPMTDFGLIIAPWHGAKSGIRMDKDGKVGIGTNNTADPEYKLFVETGIRTRKVKVDQAIWADYVFDKEYKLRSLQEVEHFITINKHLPDVPSAAEVEKEGLNLGESQAVLLRKIEELTLYAIEQEKRNVKLSLQVEKHQEQISQLLQLVNGGK